MSGRGRWPGGQVGWVLKPGVSPAIFPFLKTHQPLSETHRNTENPNQVMEMGVPPRPLQGGSPGVSAPHGPLLQSSTPLPPFSRW